MAYSVYFKYNGKTYKLPVNPEEIKRSRELNVETYQVLGTGQVSIPSYCALEEYSFEALDLGNIAHQSLERFARKADRENLAWTEMTEEKRDELIEESVEESILDYGNTVLFSSARNEYMIRRIKRLIRRSVWALTKQLEKGDFVPSGYELKFGSGKIDRIDTCEDEDRIYVKVTDYKTGMKSFDITSFYHGLQMQLPVYMNAALGVERR